MKYFERFTSNTIAGSGSQHVFDCNEKKLGRIFYKITVGGEFNYSLLYTNIIDGTFANGEKGHRNRIIDEWQIHKMRIGRAVELDASVCIKERPEATLEVIDWQDITFDGASQKTVAPAEFFTTDPVKMYFDKGDYLCVETEFSGGILHNHEESTIPAFTCRDGVWRYSRRQPFPSMIGCDRDVKKRVCFIGDSITQGCGTRINAYEHWNAVVSSYFDDSFAFWNLGLGYGRASDMASDGAWMFKARHNDYAVVCYGVNDINRGGTADEIIADLVTVVKKLKDSGLNVLIQTVPPFNQSGERADKFHKINDFIRNEMPNIADAVFDVVPVLCAPDRDTDASRFGGHPNGEGCKKWADALYPVLKEFLAK